MSLLDDLSSAALKGVDGLRDRFAASRSPWGLASFSIEDGEVIAEAVDALIQARLAERDEQWLQVIKIEIERLMGEPCANP